jgi:hypothetical protein
MAGAIEVRGFMALAAAFAARGWANPHRFAVEGEITGAQLLAALGVASEEVESLILNRRATPVDTARLHPGDRVALVPPGAPGPHRVLLGLRDPSKPAIR